VLFGAFVFVWFGEMVLWGFQPVAEVWTAFWKMVPSENAQLATALYITHAVEAPLKGALGVLAVFGLRSRNPSVRTALFVPMALVPPLNIVFQFRAQGFPLRSMAVATVLSVILWAAFFLSREAAQPPPEQATPGHGPLPASRREVLRYLWFGLNAAALTLLAVLFLFGPRTALRFIIPCWSSLLDAHEGELASLTVSNLGVGTHLLALATAGWIATAYSRDSPALRQAVAAASALNAGLMCLLPLRRIILEAGGTCATSSILLLFVPLLAGWALYAAFLYSVPPTERAA